jgi:hypothetical protein
MVTCYTISIFISLGYFIFFICVSFDRVNQSFAKYLDKGISYTERCGARHTKTAILF